MTKKTFIEDQRETKTILAALESTGECPGYYTEIFVNPLTGEKWERYLFELDDEHTDGIGLRRYPYPTISEAIEIAISTEFEDEADGAAAFLFEYENEGEFRELLIERLEKEVEHLSLSRFETIYYRAELYDQTNKRSIVGKHHEVISKDHEYFVSLADRANLLKTQLGG